MRTLLVLSLLGATAFAAPVPKELQQSLRERLQGRWVLVTMDTGGGQQVQEGDFAGYTLTIEGDKFTSVSPGGAGYKDATAVYDFRSHPMRIDIKTDSQAAKGIFKFEDGLLYWCRATENGPTPTEFKGGAVNICYIWKRAAK